MRPAFQIAEPHYVWNSTLRKFIQELKGFYRHIHNYLLYMVVLPSNPQPVNL